MGELIDCGKHGRVGFGIACIHICRAIDSGQQVGFFWGEGDDTLARPDAWCAACEEYLVRNKDVSLQDLKAFMDSQFLCERCWDEAKAKLYDGRSY